MENKTEYVTEAPLSIAEERATYVRSDGTTFTRADIHIRLHIPFRDQMLAALKGPPLSVYLCIALHCGDAQMTAYPSIQTICKETGYGRTAVISATRKLSKMGLISITHREHENGDPDSNFYRVRGYATMGEGSTPSVLGVVHEVDRGSTPSVPKEESMEEESIQEKEPASPDSPPADSLPAELVAAGEDPAQEEPFYLNGETPTKGHEPRTAEQVKAGVRRALERNAKNGNSRAGVADPTLAIDEWMGRPVKEWCAFIRLPYEEQSRGRLALFASDLRTLATTQGMDKTAEQTGVAIRAMCESESCQWLRTASRPTHKEFSGVLLNVLCGQVLPDGRGGNGRHDRPAGGEKQLAQQEIIQAAISDLFDPVTGKRKELM